MNCRVSGIDSLGVVENPALVRSQAPMGEWTHDVILANIKVEGCNCNAFTGARLRDSVFSNIAVDAAGDEKYESRYSAEVENVWFDNVRVGDQRWVWTKTDSQTGDFRPVDVRITGCSFELPKKEED